MKKIIIIAAIVLIAGLLSNVTKNNNLKTTKATQTAVALDNSVLATAD